jgi:parallel beta-helix repeat protein
MKLIRLILLSIILNSVFITELLATTFYLSSLGNDNNLGKDINKPWKTISRLNRQTLQPNDVVLFRRNDTFFGEIVIKNSGSKNRLITFSAYGTGKNPVLKGSYSLTNFSEYTTSIWKAKSGLTVKSLYHNNLLKTLARYPNTGFATMQAGVGDSITFIDSSLKQHPNYWVNSNLRFRTWDWEMRTSVVKKFSDYKVTLTDSSTNELGKGWGYYFDNKFEELDTLGEWFYNRKEKMLYYYGGKKYPSNSVEGVVLDCGIRIQKGIGYISVSNLSIEKFDVYGISLEGNNNHISITNNLIKNINHTGVYINEISKNCTIANNQISEINGRGVFALEPEWLSISNNYIHHIGLRMGYGISGVNGMIGINISNNEVWKTAESHIAIHNIIRQNRVENCGYVGIRMDGAYNLMEGNIIKNALLKLSDGAAIYCWAKGNSTNTNYTHDSQIRNNVVSDIKGSNYGTPNNDKEPAANGIYVDNNIYNFLVEGNTVSNISANGIHINSDAYDNKVNNNLVYNCTNGLTVAEWITPNTTRNNVFTNNTVFLTNNKQRGVLLVNFKVPNTKEMASFSDNKYYTFSNDTLMQEIYNSDIDKVSREPIRFDKSYTFKDWAATYGYEKNSYFKNLSAFKGDVYSQLLTNITNKPKTYNFSNQLVYDVNHNKINSITVAPFQSTIILKSKK